MSGPIIIVHQKKDIAKHLEKTLKFFDNPEIKHYLRPDEAAQKFSSMLTVAKKHSNKKSIEEFCAPSHYNSVFISLMMSGLKNVKYLSEVFHAVYDTMLLSTEYQRHMYTNIGFWEAVFKQIFSLPDVQFFEAMMTYAAVVAQVSSREGHEKIKERKDNLVFVTNSEFIAIMRYIDKKKYAQIFRRLLQIQEKDISSTNGASFGLDYSVVMERFFSTEYHRSYWKRDSSHPVDIIAMLMFTFIAHPRILNSLIKESDGVKVLNDVLRSKACKRMHVLIMFNYDTLVVTSRVAAPKMFSGLMKTIDFPLLLTYAISNDKPYPHKDSSLRRLSQKIIIDVLEYHDEDRDKNPDAYYPDEQTFAAVGLDVLERMLVSGDMTDSKFAIVVVAEIIEEESQRDIVLATDIPRVALKCMTKLLDVDQYDDDNIRFITGGVNLYSKLGFMSGKRQAKLKEINAVGVVGRLMNSVNETVRVITRTAVLNLTEQCHDARLEVFKLTKFKSLVSDAYRYYKTFRDKRIPEKGFYDIMQSLFAIIRQELDVNWFLVKENGSDNSYLNIDDEIAGQIMEIASYFILDNGKTVDSIFLFISLTATCRLLELNFVDIEKYLTNDFLRMAFRYHYNGFLGKFEDSGFTDLLIKRYPKWKSEVESYKKNFTYGITKTLSHEDEAKKMTKVEEVEKKKKIDVQCEEEEKKNLGAKCAWPPCLNYGPNKETKGSGIPLKPLKKCANCFQVAYCGRACQKLHWKEHKRHCKKE